MKPIVVVQQISKKYSRNAQTHRSYGLTDLWREITGRASDLTLRKDEFLAVDNVSFHLRRGESIALVGRNGSGKTTVLKMMNGLIKMDAGTIIMDGRVQALINLGAGFKVTLTGRDNIYNSASLMGLNRKQISRIVDEIIDFSELEEFIDSPVETYSSGMYARLGFAVAISLKPDILLIDEILSVGDYSFQNKCFIRLHELKKQGVSFVLVTHSHTHAVQICEQAIWLDRGKIKKQGPAQATVKAYLGFLDQREEDRLKRLNELKDTTTRKIEDTQQETSSAGMYGAIYDEHDRVDDLKVEMIREGQAVDAVHVHDEVQIKYRFRLKEHVTDLNVSTMIFRKEGLKLSTISTLNGDLLKDVHTGSVQCTIRIPDFNFNPGLYILLIAIHEGKSYIYRNVVKEFIVKSDGKLLWEIVDLKYDYTIEDPETQSPIRTYHRSDATAV